MRFEDKVVVVSGGGSGIGAALAQAYDSEGAIVVVCDSNGKLADHVASKCLTHPHRLRYGFHVDVTKAKQVKVMIRFLMEKYGKIDVFCSNAGIIHWATGGNASSSLGITRHSNDQWNQIFQVNVLSHIIAVRELLPYWGNRTARVGERPTFIMTASAAGILTQIGDASYGVTKAAAVSFAEHLAIEHGNILRVLCLCPQAVDTPFGNGMVQKATNSATVDGILSAQHVAECTLNATLSPEDNSNMFIFPHPKVEAYMKRKATDHSRWVKGMRRLKQIQQKEEQKVRSKL